LEKNMMDANGRSKNTIKSAKWIVSAFLATLVSLGASAQPTPPNGVEGINALLHRPGAVAFDGSGNLYVADTDDNLILEISTAGIVTTVAGTGEQGYAGDLGFATSAILDSPAGVAVDKFGSIYIADTHNNCIREVSAGVIMTIAGTCNAITGVAGAAGYSGDGGPATFAMLAYPTAVAVDSNLNVYVADTNNHRVREIAAGMINTVAGDGEQGYGGDGGPATATGATPANLDSPNGVAVDTSFNIYIGDTHNQLVRIVTASNSIINILAGQAGVKGFNGDGTASSADLARPRGVSVDTFGNVYVADSDNNLIRTINIGNASLTTIAGNGQGVDGGLEGFGGDSGPATSAFLDTPRAVGIGGSEVAFSDTENNVVRVINSSTVNTAVGQSPQTESLTLSGPFGGVYGAPGTLTATFSNGGNSSSAAVTFYDGLGASPVMIGTPQALSGNTASISTSGLGVGTHYIVASYAGDGSNPAIPSGVFVFVVTPAQLTVTATSTSIYQYAPIPTFNYTINGFVNNDPQSVVSGSPLLTTSAVQGSAPGPYTIAAALGSLSAANYTFALQSGTLTIDAVSLGALTSPSSGSTLTGSSVSFNWSAGTGATGYQLWVGSTSVNSQNLYSSGPTTNTSVLVNNLPTNGETIYARLYTGFNGTLQHVDYTFSAAAQAVLTSPSPSTTLTGPDVTFSWSAGTGTAYQLWVGSTGVNAQNLFSSGVTTGTSVSVSNLPTSGGTIFVRLYSEVNGTWQHTDYTYTAATAPGITSPAGGGILGGPSVTFNWSPGTGVTAYQLWLGSTGVNSQNLYSSGATTATSVTANNLPTDGSMIYARLYFDFNGTEQHADYTFTAATAPGITSPASGSTLGGPSATFSWSSGTGVTAYQLWVGNTGVNSQNLYSSGQQSQSFTSVTVPSLPTNGATINVRLYFDFSGTWQHADYTYTAASAPALMSPTPSSTLVGPSVTFTWSGGGDATAYQLWLGSTGVNSQDLYSSGSTTSTSVTVNSLPTNGETIYARLYVLINGVWNHLDYTFTAGSAPALTSPTQGSALSGSSVTFNWSAGTGATGYQLWLGSTGVNTNDLYSSGIVTGTSVTANHLPTNGKTIYARLYVQINGVWNHEDYIYTAATQ